MIPPLKEDILVAVKAKIRFRRTFTRVYRNDLDNYIKDMELAAISAIDNPPLLIRIFKSYFQTGLRDKAIK